MFYLYNIAGRNICQHKSFDFNLTSGLTCVIGPNGFGKSNLMEALFLLLTGESHCELDDMLKWKTTRGDLVGKIKTEDGEITLTRDLRLAPGSGKVTLKHTLVASWLPERIERKADISAFLAKYAGESLVYMDMLSFARQGQFELMLKATHSDRVTILHTLLGLKRLEKLRELLLSVRGRLQVPVDRTLQIAVHNETLDTNRVLLEAATGKKDVLDKMITQNKDEYARLSTVLLQPDKAKIQELWAMRTEDQQACTQELNVVLAALKNLMKASDLPALDMKGWRYHLNWRKAQEAADAAEQELKDADAAGAALSATENTEEMQQRLKVMEEERNLELVDAKDCDNKLELVALGRCPTCGADLQMNDADKTAIVKSRERHRGKAAALAEKIVDLKAYMEKYRLAGLAISRAKRELASKLVDLGKLKDYADFDMVAFEDASAKHTQYNEEDPLRNELTDRRTTLEDEERRLEAEIKGLEKNAGVTADQKEAAQSFCAAYDTAVVRQKEQDRVIAATSEAIRFHEEALAKDVVEQAQRVKSIASMRMLDTARDKLHANAIPMDVAKGSASKFNEYLQKYLDLFEFPYRVYMNEELDFIVDFPDKSTFADKLSGGQTIVVAMSVRFALQELFTFGCGLLILDEPTNNLDVNNQELLLEILQKAGEYFKTRKMAVLVPTHDQRIEAIAENKWSV